MKKKILITQPWSPSIVTKFETYVGWLKREVLVIVDPKQNNLTNRKLFRGYLAYMHIFVGLMLLQPKH